MAGKEGHEGLEGNARNETNAGNERSRVSGSLVTAISWDDGKLVEHPTLAAAMEAISRNVTTWIDLCGRDAESEKLLGKDGLDLHPLVIEDIFADSERPKIEEFGRYLYVVVHAPDAGAIELKTGVKAKAGQKLTELDVVFSEHWVVTHHSHHLASIGNLLADVRRSGRLLSQGAPWVAHGLLDRVVDDYVPVLDRLDVVLDELEDDVLHDPSDRVLSHIFAVKRDLQQLRRAAVHQKEVLHRLGRGDFALIPVAVVPFFRDVYDHFARVADLSESYRDLVGAALETYLSVQSNRMNAVMKTLTLTATLFMPLSFVAGFYGMNFEHMPELKKPWAYPAVIGVMLAILVGMLVFYRRRKWI